jgi:ligand-binding sensor domain-containing protein
MIHAMFEDRDGTVWLAGSDGLSRYANGALSTITVKNGLPDNQVWAVRRGRRAPPLAEPWIAAWSASTAPNSTLP